MNRFILLGAMAAVVLLTGCKSKEQGAREHFSKDNVCPEERVEVRERTDLKPSDWMTQSPPPKDVAADPARLKMWQDQASSARASQNGSDTIFEARGCGKETLYACHRHNKDWNYIMCFTESYPPGAAKW